MTLSIAIEGVDGVGKTTLVKQLNLSLHNTYKVKTIQAPGQTEAGQAIRSIVKSTKMDLCKEAQIHLFIADMWNTYRYEIELCTEVDIFLHDRSFLSTMAYQDISLKDINLFPPPPSLIIFLDIEPNLIDKDDDDRFDSRGLDYLKRIRDRYLYLLGDIRLHADINVRIVNNRDPVFIKKLIMDEYPNLPK